MLDRRLVEKVAADLQTNSALIEKDWYITRAIGVLADVAPGTGIPAFGGGTSLSKGWGLIKRFSEDIDFKVAMPAEVSRNQAKKERSAYRQDVLGALVDAGFVLAGEPSKGDENRFFSAQLLYPSMFAIGPGLRPHVRIEMSLMPAVLPPIGRPIGSLVAMAQGQPPEIGIFLCVDPVETAADKLSALAWRVRARRRGSNNDDPTIIRHLHDLAALKPSVASSGRFAPLVHRAMSDDTGRGGEATALSNPATLLAGMLEQLATDRLWIGEYQDYVDAVSFASPQERIDFHQALAALRDLVAGIPL